MITFTDKTIKENFNDPDASYNGSVEYADNKISSASAWNIQAGTSNGSAALDGNGNLSINGFKTADIITAATTVAGIFGAIEEHVTGE